MKINVSKTLPTKADTTIIMFFDFETLSGQLSKLGIQTAENLLHSQLKEHGDSLSTIDVKWNTVIFLKLDPKVPVNVCPKIFRKTCLKYKTLLGNHVVVHMPPCAQEKTESIAATVLNQLMLTANHLGKYKFKPNEVSDIKEVTIVSESYITALKTIASVEKEIAKVQLSMMDLINTPANIKTPEYVALRAAGNAKRQGFSVIEMNIKEIRKHKLEALLAVNKGSDQEPRFLVLEYKAKGKNSKTIGLVGKGVTFDTGGISVKPSTNMHYMKSDMSGAALVLAFTELCARLQLNINVVATIPLTENMVDGKATKPGDVIGSYIGKSIEVIDTDAEGRIILADGLGYLTKNFNPDVVIDFATLTGSIIQTLGYHVAGLFSNNDDLAGQLYTAGQNAGEKCWRLPIWDNYTEDLNSDVADLKNYSGKPVAGAISAALFLKEFTNEHQAWAHFDIAGVSFTDNEYGSMRNATGYGIRLLYEFVKMWESGSK